MEGTKNEITIPIAIIIAGLLIAGALFFTLRSPNGGGDKARATGPEGIRALFGKQDGDKPAPSAPAPATASLAIRAVNPDSDHVLGNPNAEIVIVEYSDLECPFCRVFHQTLARIMEEYGKGGSVAWVYRHFPLAQLHTKAQREAEATECAAELGGNIGFWKYTNRIFEVTPSNDGLDLARLPAIAAEIGLDRKAFEACLSSGRHTSRIETEYTEATSAGGRGTPFNILLLRKPLSESKKQELLPLFERYRDPRDGSLPIAFSADNARMMLSGALPYELMKVVLDTILK